MIAICMTLHIKLEILNNIFNNKSKTSTVELQACLKATYED